MVSFDERMRKKSYYNTTLIAIHVCILSHLKETLHPITHRVILQGSLLSVKAMNLFLQPEAIFHNYTVAILQRFGQTLSHILYSLYIIAITNYCKCFNLCKYLFLVRHLNPTPSVILHQVCQCLKNWYKIYLSNISTVILQVSCVCKTQTRCTTVSITLK